MKNEYLELLIDSFPGAMILVDKNGIILGLNKGLAQILSKPREELIGTPAFIHIEKQIAKSRLIILQEVVTNCYTTNGCNWKRIKSCWIYSRYH